MIASSSSSRACSHGAASSSMSTPMAVAARRPVLVLLPARGAMAASCSGGNEAAATSERRRRLAVGSGGRRTAIGGGTLCRAIEEKRDTTGEAAGAPENLVSEIERLAAARRADNAPEPSAQPQGGQNPFEGALSEARLITWPRPQKALLDTALVLGIVAGTSALVFGLNVVLAELATAWYKSH